MVLNNKKTGASISKVLLMMFSLLVMIGGVTAYDVTSAEARIDTTFDEEDLVFQNVNNLIYPSEGNLFPNIPFSWILSTEPVYVNVKNLANESISFTLNNIASETNTFNLEIGEEIWLRITPDIEGEYITLNFPDKIMSYNFYYPNDNGRETALLELISPFTGAIEDLVAINISIWRLGFFIFIVIIPLAFLSLIVWGIFKLIEWARHLSEVKEDILKGRDRRN